MRKITFVIMLWNVRSALIKRISINVKSENKMNVKCINIQAVCAYERKRGRWTVHVLYIWYLFWALIFFFPMTKTHSMLPNKSKYYIRLHVHLEIMTVINTASTRFSLNFSYLKWNSQPMSNLFQCMMLTSFRRFSLIHFLRKH